MNANENLFDEWVEINTEDIDLENLSSQLEAQLNEQMDELSGLELDHEKIGNPDSIGEVVETVVMEQLYAQIGVESGHEFQKKNRGLSLDLRECAHRQTGDRFKEAIILDGQIDALQKKVDSGSATLGERVDLIKKQCERTGKVATHNSEVDYKKRYESYHENFQYNSDGAIKTAYDRIDKEDKPVLKGDYRNPFDTERNKDPQKVGSSSVHMDETVSIGEQCRSPEVNAHMDKEDIIRFDTSDDNLNPMSGPANESKSDHKAENWLKSERNGQKPADRFDIDEEQIKEKDRHARKVLKEKIDEGKKQGDEAGIASRKAEAKLISGQAAKAIAMQLLVAFLKDVIRQLVKWFRSGQKKFSTFLDSFKTAFQDFMSKLKEHLLNSANTALTTIISAIFGPIIGTLKKAWIFLKQGWKSLKEAINYLKNPVNKDQPLSVKMLKVGKIVIGGLTAGGAIVLGELLEKILLQIPGFGFEIPLLGSLANILGLFLGALVSGIIGAIALNLIDKAIAKKLRKINDQQRIDKSNQILSTQDQLMVVTQVQAAETKSAVSHNINQRHQIAAEVLNDTLSNINVIKEQSEKVDSDNQDKLDNMFNDLNSLP